MMKKPFPLLPLVLAWVLGACSPDISWTKSEQAVTEQATPLRVLTVNSAEDLEVLRAQSSRLNRSDLQSPIYAQLAEKMLLTVTDSSQNGVGIAAPQVGVSRRVVAVKRVDKRGSPWEVYPNIEIVAVRGEPAEGREGCLSVPGRRGMVRRWQDIDIRYSLIRDRRLCDTVERVEGYAAVIFQHECDHLQGVIYTDKTERMLE